PVLHVHRAGHRAAGLLRGPAGARLRDLPRRLPGRFRLVPHGPGPVDVGDPGEGVRGRRRDDRQDQGLRAADDPGQGAEAGRQPVLRPVRSERHLALRPGARLRAPVPLRAGAGGRAAWALAREPKLVGSPFFARFDPNATWLSDLEPVFAPRFPYEPAPEGVLPGLWP